MSQTTSNALPNSSKSSGYSSSYKNSTKNSSKTRRDARNQASVQLRKQKKVEILHQKRFQNVEIEEDYLISSDEDNGNPQAIQKNTVNVEENPRKFSDTVEIPPADFRETVNSRKEEKILKTGVKHEFEVEKCPERYLKRRKKSATEMLIDFLRSEDFLEYTRNTVLEGSRTLKNLCSPKDLHSRIKEIVEAEPLATQLIKILCNDQQIIKIERMTSRGAILVGMTSIQ